MMLKHFLMSNYYANKYAATPIEFRIAVPPGFASKENFEFAGELLNLRYPAFYVRQKLCVMIRQKLYKA